MSTFTKWELMLVSNTSDDKWSIEGYFRDEYSVDIASLILLFSGKKKSVICLHFLFGDYPYGANLYSFGLVPN